MSPSHATRPGGKFAKLSWALCQLSPKRRIQNGAIMKPTWKERRMLQHRSPRDDFNRVSIEILFADADLAMTFTQMALERSEPAAVARITGNARKAYQEISRIRSSLPMSALESERLDAKLKVIRKGLRQLGLVVS
jgi:hypothetical protein